MKQNKIRILAIAPYESMKMLMIETVKKFDDIELTVFIGDLEQGLLLLTAKDRVRLLPPLTISKDELDRGVAILADVLSK